MRVRPALGAIFRIGLPAVLAAALILSMACVTPGRPAAGTAKAQGSKYPPPAAASADPRARVLASARALLGQKPYARVVVRGRVFELDCIGTVSAAWWGAGWDIQRDFPKYSGNGVKRLYDSLKAWGAAGVGRRPKPGDFIFWEDTYDRNGNGKLYDDGITHAGIVVSTDADGTVEYLHLSYSRGVVLAFCNLDHPDRGFGPGGKIWNSPMFQGSGYNNPKNPPKWLSGALWEAFGDAAVSARTLGG